MGCGSSKITEERRRHEANSSLDACATDSKQPDHARPTLKHYHSRGDDLLLTVSSSASANCSDEKKPTTRNVAIAESEPSESQLPKKKSMPAFPPAPSLLFSGNTSYDMLVAGLLEGYLRRTSSVQPPALAVPVAQASNPPSHAADGMNLTTLSIESPTVVANVSSPTGFAPWSSPRSLVAASPAGEGPAYLPFVTSAQLAVPSGVGGERGSTDAAPGEDSLHPSATDAASPVAPGLLSPHPLTEAELIRRFGAFPQTLELVLAANAGHGTAVALLNSALMEVASAGPAAYAPTASFVSTGSRDPDRSIVLPSVKGSKGSPRHLPVAVLSSPDSSDPSSTAFAATPNGPDAPGMLSVSSAVEGQTR